MEPSRQSILEERARRLHSLVEVDRRISQARGLDAVLRVVTEGASHVLDAERATLFLYDRASGSLWSKVAQGLESPEIRLRLGEGIAGHVAETRETIVTDEPARDPRFNPEVDRATGFVTRSLICVPLLGTSGDLVGVLEVLNRRGGPFDAEDREVLNLCASHAAAVLESAILAEEARRQAQLAAVGRVAGGLVHDLRGSMTIIKGYAEMLELTTEREREFCAIILDEVDRMALMIQDIFDFVRGGSGKEQLVLADVDLAEVLRGVVKRHAPAVASRPVELTIETVPGMRVRANASKLERAFDNLLRNAFDAVDDGGRVRFDLRRAGARLEVRVTNDGSAVPQEIRATLFEPFVTARKEGGTGLGLAIVRRIVEAHGGIVQLEQSDGHTTTFLVVLPSAEAAAQAVAASRQESLDDAVDGRR